MSALQDYATSRRRPAAPAAPRLRTVEAPVAPLRQLPFLLVLAGILGIGMAGLLVLNTTVQNQSFELSDKQATATRLSYTEVQLQHELDKVSSPRSLAMKATGLGMRPYARPGFLVLPDGTVIGAAEESDGKAFPTGVVKSPQQLAAEKAAAQRRAAAARKAAEKKATEDKKAAEEKKAAEKKQSEQDEGSGDRDGGGAQRDSGSEGGQ